MKIKSGFATLNQIPAQSDSVVFMAVAGAFRRCHPFSLEHVLVCNTDLLHSHYDDDGACYGVDQRPSPQNGDDQRLFRPREALRTHRHAHHDGNPARQRAHQYHHSRLHRSKVSLITHAYIFILSLPSAPSSSQQIPSAPQSRP